jgi:hypothetical protein
MKLRSIEANECSKGVDIRGLGIYEDSHGFDFLGKLGADLRGIGGHNAAEALFVKIKAEGIGAGVGGGFSVGKIGDAADFDADHSG